MPSTLSKSFSPNIIVDGGITTLSFTVVVDDMSGSSPIVFSDTLPSGLMTNGNYVVPPPFDELGVVTVSPITITVQRPAVPNGTYVLEFEVTNVPGQLNPSCEFNPQEFTNQSSNLFLFPGPPEFTFDGVPSCLIVTDIVPPMELIVEKSFSPSSILVGGVSTLTITITNPNPFPVVGVAFNDVYPLGVVTANPTNYISGGNVLPPPIPGGNNLNWLKVTGIGPFESVTISVDVTSDTVGVYNNSTGVVTNLQIIPLVPPSAGASAILTVKAKTRRRRGSRGMFMPPNQICVANNGKNEERVPYYGYIYIFYRKDERGNLCYIRTNQRG